MQLNKRNWLAGVAVATLVFTTAPAFVKESADPAPVGSLSGAFLAARVAEVDDDLDSAIAYYRNALAFDPDNRQLQQSLMLALITKGRFNEALPYAEKLKSVPDVERFSRLALAVEAFRKPDYQAAQNLLQLALQSDLDRLITGLMTAWAKLGAGDAKDALAYLDQFDGPEWYGIFKTYHRALIAEAGGVKDEAEAAYKAVLDDVMGGSGAPETWLRAADAYATFLAREGRKEDALAVLDRSEEFSVGRLPTTVLRNRIQQGASLPVMVPGPRDGATEVLLNLGTALNRGGGESFVRLYLQYALALKPDSDVVLMELASVAEQQEDAEEAISLYARVSGNSPLKRLAELQRGLNLADLDRHDEAVALLRRLVEERPDDMRGYLALGGAYASKEDFKSAAEVYDQAVAQLTSPTREHWNIFYQRGIAYERLKRWPEAEPNFKKALELYPEQPQVMNYLGYSWVDMNLNLEEGLDLIRRAVELRPSDGYIVDSLGWAYYRLGRYEDAVRELERAVSLKPDDPVLNDHLGDAYWQVGRKLEASFQWSHARDMKPEPDLLASVEKKLKEGLAPVENKAAEQAPAAQPVPSPPVPQTPERRSEVAPAPVAPAAIVQPANYRVQPGQSLWEIAVERLGDGHRYREILELNPELRGNPARLRAGQELRLPAGSQ